MKTRLMGRGVNRPHSCVGVFLVISAMLASSLVLASAVGKSDGGPSLLSEAVGDRNILYLIVDDLRPQMTNYNQTFMHTPNFQRLAGESLVFERAYCQDAVCVASRNSFLSGRRPDITKVWSGMAKSFRDTGPHWTSLPEHFKNAGFTVLGGGKTYHPHSPPNWDEPKSWSQDVPYFPFQGAHCPNKTGESVHSHGFGESGQVTGSDTWCALDENEYPYSYHYDNKLANHTVGLLEYVKKKGGPFFIAAGFRRPHVPWMMPKHFWDLYDNKSAVPPPLHVQRPLNSPDIAFHNQGVFDNTDHKSYLPMPSPIPTDIQQAVRRAYFASVSFTDYNIGLVLDALDRLELSNSTIVVLHGDHGFQLGEHDSWHKQTNWELAARVPLLVRVPWKPASSGKHSFALVELIDMYRTLSELVEISHPPDDVNGTSFAPIFDTPSMTSAQFSKMAGKPNAAFSQYLRCVNNATAQWANNWCSSKEENTLMGYSMRTDVWRYTAWMQWKRTAPQVDWTSKPKHVELYSHEGSLWLENDFNHFENENIAAEHADTVTQLHAQLKAFYAQE